MDTGVSYENRAPRSRERRRARMVMHTILGRRSTNDFVPGNTGKNARLD